MRKLFAVMTIVGFGMFACSRLNAAEGDSKSAVEPIDLAVGARAPAFESVDDRCELWSSDDHVTKKYMVIYFYPADFTGGCTKQAEAFRNTMNQLADRGIEVIGVSADSVTNHEMFKRSWLLNYTLLADADATVAAKFGVPVKAGGNVVPYGPDRKRLLDGNGESFRLERKATFARWTFIVGKDGKILYKNTKVQPAKDSQQVLEFIQDLEKEAAGLPD
jgi:peroxiredoxin Q/BCP